MTTSCSAGSCSSYYGPNPAHVLGQALLAKIENSNSAAEARLYTPDKKLLWKSADQKGDHVGSIWADKLRLGTNSPECKVGAWSRHSYKTYRHWASTHCSVQFPSAVSIDLKMLAKANQVHVEAAAQKQMVDNAEAAARKQAEKSQAN